MKKKKKKKKPQKPPTPPEPADYTQAIVTASAAIELLAKKIAKYEAAQPSRSHFKFPSGHREPTPEQIYALEAALDVAVSAAHLCASMHPQGCPPGLQMVSEAIDEGLRNLSEALRYTRQRFIANRPDAETPRLATHHGR